MDTTTDNKKKRILLAILLLLLLGSFIGNIVLFSKRGGLISERDKAALNSESMLSLKLQVEKQLNEAQGSLNKFKTDNELLNSVIAKLNTEIAEKRTVLEKITKDNNNVGALRKQLKDAKKLRDDCEKEVNDYIKENNKLEASNNTLRQSVNKLSQDNEDLKKKLEWAKNLKAYDVGVMNFKVTKSKQRPTIRARKVDRISVSFTLAENLVAEAGSKNIYLVIYDPKKNILAKTSDKFTNTKTNSEQVYSVSKSIDFKNEDQKATINYDTDDKLVKGKYRVEIYADGSLSGKKEFELR